MALRATLLRIGCVVGLSALSGCSSAAVRGNPSPIQEGDTSTSAEAAPTTEPPHAAEPGDPGANQAPPRTMFADQPVLDELETGACANGCTVIGQDPAPQVGPGGILCSTQLAWQTPGWVDAEIGISMGSGAKLAADSLGNAYFGGTFAGSITLGPFSGQTAQQATTGFVMKLGPDCTPLELKQFAGEAFSQVNINALAIDRDDNLILGGLVLGTVDFGLGPITTELESGERRHYGIVLKLNREGELLWHRVLIGNNTATFVYDLGVSATGDITVSGIGGSDVHFEGSTAPDDTSATALFVASLSASGEPGPIHRMFGSDVFGSIAVDASGRVAITGFAYQAMPRGVFAELAWSQELYDHYVLMLDPSGALEWSFQLEQVTLEDINGLLGYALTFDGSGNLIATHGRTTFHDDGTKTHRPQALLKLAPGGEEAWSLESLYEGQGTLQWLNEVATDTHDNIVHVDELVPDVTLDGASYTVRGARDILVHKVDRDGAPLWSAQVGSDGDDMVWGLATDRDDAVWVGSSERSEDFSEGTISIRKLAP